MQVRNSKSHEILNDCGSRRGPIHTGWRRKTGTSAPDGPLAHRLSPWIPESERWPRPVQTPGAPAPQTPGQLGPSPCTSKPPPNRLPTSLCGFGFGLVSHTSNIIRVMKPKPYIINIIRCPTVFLSRVFSVILSAHYAFPKLNRVLKSGTRALWCDFSPAAVLRVSRASLPLSSRPFWRAIPVIFCHSTALCGPEVTPAVSAGARAW